MKKLVLFCLLSSMSGVLYGQVAGNAVYSNTTSYNTTTQMPRAVFVSDTVMLLSADVLMNVPPIV